MYGEAARSNAAMQSSLCAGNRIVYAGESWVLCVAPVLIWPNTGSSVK
jgi:hypothetical protein